jgi:hypothetical protein
LRRGAADRKGLGPCQQAFANFELEPAAHALKLLPARPGDGHRETAATQMRGEILGPQRPSQLGAELRQRAVAGGVAGHQVELVQPVELERHQGGIFPRRAQVVEEGALLQSPVKASSSRGAEPSSGGARSQRRNPPTRSARASR